MRDLKSRADVPGNYYLTGRDGSNAGGPHLPGSAKEGNYYLTGRDGSNSRAEYRVIGRSGDLKARDRPKLFPSATVSVPRSPDQGLIIPMSILWLGRYSLDYWPPVRDVFSMFSVMAAEIMYGKPVAEQIENRVRAGVEELARTQRNPAAGHRTSRQQSGFSALYQEKGRSLRPPGYAGGVHLFPEDVSGAKLRDEVYRLSTEKEVHGILVQLPLPPHIEDPPPGQVGKFEIFDNIAPAKDVDGVSRYSVPELYRAQRRDLMFLPGTAVAVLAMLAFYKIATQGKVAVVVGRNDITAKPLHHILEAGCAMPPPYGVTATRARKTTMLSCGKLTS